MEYNKFSNFSGTQDVVVLAVAIGLVAAWFVAYLYFTGSIHI
jgi:hypothetical protein